MPSLSRRQLHRPRPESLHAYPWSLNSVESGGFFRFDYFIEMQLAELRDKPVAADVDWARVDAFRQCGGIRIEEDVVCTGDAPEDLARDAFAAPD